MHTGFQRGQSVFVHLRNGEKFKDWFVVRKSRYVVLRLRGKIPTEQIRAISIWRNDR